MKPACGVVASLSIGLAACGGDDGGGGAAPPRVVTFHAEQQPFAGFGYDTGLQPAESPVQVRFVLSAGGGLAVDAKALSAGDEAAAGLAGSGQFSLDGQVILQASLKVDLPGYSFDGPLEGVPEIAIVLHDARRFDPFLLGGSVDLAAVVPETELAAVPLEAATGVPGTLHISASGTVTSAFSGRCAEASTPGVTWLGATATGGTLQLSATVVVEIPFLDPQPFGPFALPPIPLGPFELPVDFGTQARGDAAPAGAAAAEAAGVGACAVGDGSDAGGGGVGPTGDAGPAAGGAGGEGSPGGIPAGGGGGTGGGGPTAGASGSGGAAGGSVADAGAGGSAADAGEPPPADPSLVGRRCDACPGNPCFDMGEAGVCSYDCTAEPDACGAAGACVPVGDDHSYCFTACTPRLGDNECAGPGSACDLYGVCLPACAQDADCATGWERTAYCNLDLGLCQSIGSPQARVGDYCTTDAECPRNGLCVTTYPGGRCTVVGCDLGGAFTCPQDSTCIPAAEGLTPDVYLSICAVNCDPANPGAVCRQGEECLDMGTGQSVCIPPQ